MKGFAEWTFEGGLKKKQIAFSRCRREPNPLSIRHIWMYVTEWTIHCQFEWYRDKRAKALLPSQDFILRRSDRRQSAPRNFRFSEHFSLCL